jgi:hypothetical protein
LSRQAGLNAGRTEPGTLMSWFGGTTLSAEIFEMANGWPHLDYLGWRETCSALHLYLQIAGKYRLAHSPWLNHSWNATF